MHFYTLVSFFNLFQCPYINLSSISPTLFQVPDLVEKIIKATNAQVRKPRICQTHKTGHMGTKTISQLLYRDRHLCSQASGPVGKSSHLFIAAWSREMPGPVRKVDQSESRFLQLNQRQKAPLEGCEKCEIQEALAPCPGAGGGVGGGADSYKQAIEEAQLHPSTWFQLSPKPSALLLPRVAYLPSTLTSKSLLIFTNWPVLIHVSTAPNQKTDINIGYL